MNQETFSQGDYVVAKKWDGSEIMGIYEYPYLDGTDCITNAKDNHRCCTQKGSVRKATTQEENIIRKYQMSENAPINEDEFEQILVAVE